MDPSDRWAFHLLEPWQFEQLAATVLANKYGIQLLSFSEGKDGGRDAVARGASIALGKRSTLKEQTVVMQAKHTRKINGILDDGLRRLIIKPEVKKARKLVENGELDVYIIVMNYGIPAGQEEKIVKCFQACGVKHVVVVGKETLIRWIKESKELNKTVSNIYGIGGPGIRQVTMSMSDEVQGIKEDVKSILCKMEDFRKCESERKCQLDGVPEKKSCGFQELEKIAQELLHAEENVRSASLKTESRRMQRVREDVKEISNSIHARPRSMDAMRRKMQYRESRSGSRDMQEIETSKRKRHCDCDRLLTYMDQEITDGELLNLSSGYGVVREWRFLARHLGGRELAISEITSVSSSSPRDQAHRALILWRENTPSVGSRKKLIEALRACHLNGQADELERNPKTSVPHL